VEQVHSPQEAYLLPKLRYQLAEFLNPSSLKRLRRLSPHPPVSVYGTVNANLKLRGFSRKRGVDHFEDQFSVLNDPPDFPGRSTYGLERHCCR